MSFPARRLRRLRRTPALRRLVAETRVTVDDLVAPLFVREGIDEPQPIASLPGVVQHTRDSLRKEARELAALGVPAVMLFGVPATKDAEGSGAWDPDGIVQLALQDLRDETGDDLVLMADLCLDEYTDHGHCGVLTADGSVDNDRTLALYGRVATAQAKAGADIVAPSGMMDGQVAAIRAALDDAPHADTAILAYAAKFASALYGPFRDAVDVSIADGGDRKGYQQDLRNGREALEEIRLDVLEGADMVMVKPALAYLDVLARARPEIDVPLAAYHVSGEYSMIKAAAANGWIDGTAVALEHLTAIKRAGADVIITYLSREVAELLDQVTSNPDSTNAALFARAGHVIPGGVNSPVRAFGSVGGTPYFVAKAEGPHIWDVEGRRYIDLVQSYGAIALGHANPSVVDAVQSAAADGTSYGAPTEREVQLAEAIVDAVGSIEKVRLVSSGTEATMSAIRLARGFTGRRKLVKFAGNYHGHADALLVAGGSGVATLGLPGSAGVTDAQVADTVVAPYNAVPSLDDETACVIVEPIAANMGLIPPQSGFLEALRAECDRVGALLIFDEVITGFRVARGGAQSLLGVRPDLTCLGKVIGGGLPVGAFGGRADVMDALAPVGPVYQAGTLSGNPLATAAGLAALGLLDERAYATLSARAERLASGLAKGFADAGLEVQVPRVASLVGVYFGAELPTDYDGARRTDEPRYAQWFHGLLDRGIAVAPGAYEVMFPGLAHSPEIIDDIVEHAAEVATALAAG